MREKLRAKVLICLVTVFGFFAAGEARIIHVAVPTLSMVVIAFTAAKEKGYYREEDLDVNLVVMRDTLGVSALIGGNVDFATMSGAGLTAIIGGVPLRWKEAETGRVTETRVETKVAIDASAFEIPAGYTEEKIPIPGLR